MSKKIALISGSNSRLGRYIVAYFLQKKYIVYAGLHSKQKTSLFMNKNAIEISLDVTNDKSIKYVIASIKKKHKTLDVLVNNAALSLSGDFKDMDVDQFEKIISVNQIGPFSLIKEAIPIMKTKSNIINIASLNSILPLPRYPLYVSTKFALLGFSRALYYEMYNKIFVTAIAPGAIEFPDQTITSTSRGARDKMHFLKLLFPFTKPNEVISTINKVLESQNPPSQVFVGSDTTIVSFLLKVLPQRLVDKAILYVWHTK